MFVYGQDYTRAMNILFIPGYVQALAGVITLFICLAAVVLSIIRRKFQLPRSDSVSAFIDTIIPFIGGGNVRIDHKCEKWFFGIVIIGAFFITSLFTGDLLDCVYLVLFQKIETFAQLAAINSTFLISPTLSLHILEIAYMLRCVTCNNCETFALSFIS